MSPTHAPSSARKLLDRQHSRNYQPTFDKLRLEKCADSSNTFEEFKFCVKKYEEKQEDTCLIQCVDSSNTRKQFNLCVKECEEMPGKCIDSSNTFEEFKLCMKKYEETPDPARKPSLDDP
jgi:hypothetical protein